MENMTVGEILLKHQSQIDCQSFHSSTRIAQDTRIAKLVCIYLMFLCTQHVIDAAKIVHAVSMSFFSYFCLKKRMEPAFLTVCLK
jgi:hypothetical protein